MIAATVLRGGRGKVMWLDPEDSSVPRGAALRRPAASCMSGSVAGLGVCSVQFCDDSKLQ